MSEISNHFQKRIAFVVALFHKISQKENTLDFIHQHAAEIDSVLGEDIIVSVDQLMKRTDSITDLKQNINKLLNVLGKTVKAYPLPDAEKSALMDALLKNYEKLDEYLREIKPQLRKLNEFPDEQTVKLHIERQLRNIQLFESYYLIKENVLFPLMEKHFPQHACLSVMWSFHDDIRKHLKKSLYLISSEAFDLKKFNRSIADMFFNMYAIKLRDERILFPFLQKTIPDINDETLLNECIAIGFPYFQPSKKSVHEASKASIVEGKIDLETGFLAVEQLKLLFQHLPVDITYVDANDKVCYFSDPPHRIFPRSKAIIGRDVHKCHPPESVHVVEEIIKAFRDNLEQSASFWIDFRGKKILIQYFALRDAKGKYQGVIEVSQEITNIQKLKGEQRLLDWKT